MLPQTLSFHGWKASTKARPRILRFLFHGSKRQLPRKVGSSADSKKASAKVFRESSEVASTKSRKLHPRNLTFYFHGSFRSFHGISAASSTALTDIFLLYTTVPPVELTTFSTAWLTHTVYETKGVLPYNSWLLRFIGLGLGLGLGYI